MSNKTEQPAVLGPVQRGVRALLTERETIARQAMRLEALEIENERLRRNIKNAINNIVCIGGPLNDNKLGYSKQQMVTFWLIKEELEA